MPMAKGGREFTHIPEVIRAADMPRKCGYFLESVKRQKIQADFF